MLVIPMTSKINWKNPPWVTIVLILLSTFIFIFFQHNDHEYYREAKIYYFESGLAQIELPVYLSWLGTGEKKDLPGVDTLNDPQAMAYHLQMESDFDFLSKLLADRIITPADPAYADWKTYRTNYERLRSRAVFYTFGFKPGFFEPLTLITCMFLHSSAGHLIGNMIFLWLVGCILEAGCGKTRYVLIYLLTGVCASLLFKLIYFHSTIPLVGASGAISGLMGAFTILFGRKKLKVFLTLGFFFNYMKIKGFYLFILWIGNELVQLIWGGTSSVAYMAHIGGLLPGGAMALILLKIPNAVDRDIFKSEPEDLISPMIEQALEKMARLDLEGAKEILLNAQQKDPANYQVMVQLFKIFKQSPKQKRFHDISQKMLDHLIRTRSHVLASELFNEYHQAAGTIKLSPTLLVRLCFSLCEAGCPDKSYKLISGLAQKDKTIPGLSTALFRASMVFKQNKEPEKCKKCQDYILGRFPHSNEAGLILKHRESHLKP